MGGWSNALAGAGLQAGFPARPRTRRWTEEACWNALLHAVDELGEIPSVLAYERLAAGRSDLPSSATIRNRLGRWSSLAARVAAHRQLVRETQARGGSAGRRRARV
jgi:hypothetical protein